jgi:hypothetical protein
MHKGSKRTATKTATSKHSGFLVDLCPKIRGMAVD